MKKSRVFVAGLLFVILALSGFNFSVSASSDESEGTDTFSSETTEENLSEYSQFSDMNGKKIAMLTGAPFEELIKSKVPEVGQLDYYQSTPDLMVALKAKKIDAFLTNNAIAYLQVNKDPEMAVFPEHLGDSTFGLAFEKGSSERAKWQEAYNELSQEELDALWDKWTGADDSIKTVPEQTWPGSNGTVKAAVADTLEPMSYVADNGQPIGFDVELILILAEKLDVHVEFTGMEFAAIMTEVQSGKAQIGAGSIIVTDERKELVDFVDYYPSAFVLVTRSNSKVSSNTSFVEKMKESFYRTFIKEARYKMILAGLVRTVIIAMAAGLIGIILGFILVLIRYKNNVVCNKIISIYCSLITGIPVVVILMVFYYVIFGSTDISAVIVAIVGFSIIFASRVYGILSSSLKSVDPGQREAALALGYSENKTFWKIVLPQARNIYLPLMKTQFVMLLKETSVAGYISVVDLTRAGDLIRSRTMDAFFPLIAIAVIYFILTWIFAKLIDVIDLKTNARKSNKKVKGEN